MSNNIGDPGHGHSPAAWTAVVIMLIAVSIGTFFFFMDMPIFVWAAAGLLVIGLVVGWVMKRAGYGVGGSKVAAKEH
ncbi:heme exporter protein D [Microbacterium trichothecenolyticum]|uniref:DUF6704 family protein n=1 Tax=Microbacterium trichothecenolyticum TaxID=69370 RepID=UPI0028598758|nr:DUF6704 family protein [Microbacterium trichothecenolyticum]MDR7186026.1 heme exporter protein D [Microbacterium trichothecenolyticum]